MNLSSFVCGYYPVSVPSVNSVLSSDVPAEEWSSGLSTNVTALQGSALPLSLAPIATLAKKGYPDPAVTYAHGSTTVDSSPFSTSSLNLVLYQTNNNSSNKPRPLAYLHQLDLNSRGHSPCPRHSSQQAIFCGGLFQEHLAYWYQDNTHSGASLTKNKMKPDDFTFLKVIGRGSARWTSIIVRAKDTECTISEQKILEAKLTPALARNHSQGYEGGNIMFNARDIVPTEFGLSKQDQLDKALQELDHPIVPFLFDPESVGNSNAKFTSMPVQESPILTYGSQALGEDVPGCSSGHHTPSRYMTAPSLAPSGEAAAVNGHGDRHSWRYSYDQNTIPFA
ncbi:MAG: hypothetical protein J3Q66DRAFT_389402 [Benniella sp.]|nr:MAG: hypothetical protein J3Q66DRAFT_389402 [Benniella sp.]